MDKQSEGCEARGDRLWLHAVGIILYIFVALASTWALPARATSRLPIGTEEARTVPMFNAWTLWWNADRLAHAGKGYWDAPIFYPERNTFAFSEPQPMAMSVAPIIWGTGSRALAYNVYLWLSLVLNGWLTQVLLRYVGVRSVAAIGAGIAMVLLPVVHWQIGVLQLVPLWGILWTWLAFAKLATPRSAPSSIKEVGWRGTELGLAFASTFLLSVHHALFLAVLMVAGAWTLGRKTCAGRTLCALGVAVVVAALLASPILIHLRKMTADHGFTRTREVVDQLSLQIRDYGNVYGHTWLPGGDPTELWLASTGWLKLFCAGLGICFGLLAAPRRTWTCFLLTVGLLSFILSLGTHVNLAGWQPWESLIAYVPGFAQVRSAFRFVYFVHIAVVLAAAQGIDGAWTSTRSWLNRRAANSSTRIGAACVSVALIVLGLIAIADPWPPRLKLGVLPDTAAHRDWIEVLKTSQERGAVLCLPMAAGDHVRDFETTTEWMMLGTFHGRPLVNGYSGFFPTRYLQLREESWSGPISDATFEQLYREGVRFVVVDRRRYTLHWSDQQEIGPLIARRIHRSQAGIELYQLAMALP